jgi:hypothetical protein
MMKRENTASGRLQEGLHIGDSGAKTVARVMKRQEKVQGTSNGGKFEIISDNQAYCARSGLADIAKDR